MFIHPTQQRTLTPREAARVQSFPDWFEFPVARTHQFRVIGNAVPPLVAEAVGIAVNDYLNAVFKGTSKNDLADLPENDVVAIKRLIKLVGAAEQKTLRTVTLSNFLNGWYSVGFLYAGLHPDSAIDHGTDVADIADGPTEIQALEPRLLAPYYVRSGWPLILEPIATEAWRRYEAGQLSDDEFYCNEAVIAGIHSRSAKATKKASR